MLRCTASKTGGDCNGFPPGLSTEGSGKAGFTAETRRAQRKKKTFHRKDAKYAKKTRTKYKNIIFPTGAGMAWVMAVCFYSYFCLGVLCVFAVNRLFVRDFSAPSASLR
jgi:hypothetical protein